MEILLAILCGFFKALRDFSAFRWEKGWLSQFDAMNKWRNSRPHVLWVEVNLWHMADMLSYVCIALAVLSLSWLVAILFVAVAMTSFTFFYHIVLEKDPIAGAVRLFKMYFGNSLEKIK